MKFLIFSFLVHWWRSRAMGFWKDSDGTRSLAHSSILNNLFIKVKLKTLYSYLPYLYIHILESTSKAYIFPDTKD